MKINEEYRKGYFDAFSQMHEDLAELESSFYQVIQFGSNAKKLNEAQETISQVKHYLQKQHDLTKMIWEATEDGQAR
jgi:hypothetical protein